MTVSHLVLSILETLDVVIFLREGPRRYRLFGSVPSFYYRLFPVTDGAACAAPWDHSEMLAFFLEDAEVFFQRETVGKISSGLWQEHGVGGEDALITTAMVCEEGQVIMLRRISDEYIDRVKILQKARENLLERRRLTTDLEIYKQKSRFDALTTLYNRATFMEKLRLEMSQAQNADARLSLLLLDIDDFKLINDTYGHLAGDAVLSALGQLLRINLRREDVAGRYGGEEFIIFASGIDPVQTKGMAEKLRTRIASHIFGALPPITVSIGYAAYSSGETPEELIARADAALYDAKRQGKNRECGR